MSLYEAGPITAYHSRDHVRRAEDTEITYRKDGGGVVRLCTCNYQDAPRIIKALDLLAKEERSNARV